jgi:hypothetical protein
MKINSSAVAMSGSSSYSHYQESEVKTVTMSASKWNALQEAVKQEADNDAASTDTGDDVTISNQGQSLWEKLKEKQEELAKKQQSDILKASDVADTQAAPVKVSDKDEQMLATLKRILESLRRMQKGEKMYSYQDMVTEIKSDQLFTMDSQLNNTVNRLGLRQSTTFSSMSSSLNVIDLRSTSSSAGTSSGVGSLWVRHTETNSFVMEQEGMTFSTTGVAKTEEGREISFGLDLQMSRAFTGNIFSSKDEQYIMTDPLVINLDSNTASVSDQKFYFDLDSDGKQEEISSLSQGSGFLAYDKNGDGVINDGSELFGTKSGDGFKDLAAYDEDGNGWIDENDDIFNKLKVWTKDENGNDRLLDLKEANVGVIYLGSANTQFHLNDATTNQTNGMIQKTGIFLHETGEVGTIQHVDLAV